MPGEEELNVEGRFLWVTWRKSVCVHIHDNSHSTRSWCFLFSHCKELVEALQKSPCLRSMPASPSARTLNWSTRTLSCFSPIIVWRATMSRFLGYTLGVELFISAKGLTRPSPSLLECLWGFEELSRARLEEEPTLLTDLSSPVVSFALTIEMVDECRVSSLSAWLWTLPSY